MSKSKNFDVARGQRIRGLRKSLGENQSQFADRLDVEQATISRWEAGNPVKQAYWKHLAELAGVPPMTFIFGEAERIPLLTKIAASSMNFSEDILTEDDVEKWIAYSDLEDGDWIAMLVSGNSMDMIAPDGSIIFVNRSDKKLKDGGYYVFRHGNDTTFKMYAEKPSRLEPVSFTIGLKAIFPDDDGFEVVGRVRRVVISV